jgi:hypothetical protein
MYLKIFYQPSGYQETVKKSHKIPLNTGYDFSIDEMRDWLERQLLHLMHKSHPKYIPRVSFNTIIVPNAGKPTSSKPGLWRKTCKQLLCNPVY